MILFDNDFNYYIYRNRVASEINCSFDFSMYEINDVDKWITGTNPTLTKNSSFQVEVPILVHSRGLDVFLSADKLIVSTDSAFTIESKVVNHDNESYSVEVRRNNNFCLLYFFLFIFHLPSLFNYLPRYL